MSWGVATQNGVSVSLASIVSLSAGVTEFSPADLFTSGTVGAWYDPSDYSTLFQDSLGQTPVTAVEQPVGLMLDKSQGLVIGSELITNGDFASGTTGWTAVNSTLANVSNTCQITANGVGAARAEQTITTVPGKWYAASASAWKGTTSISVSLVVVGIVQSTVNTTTTPTTLTAYFLATGTSTTIWVGTTGVTTAGETAFCDNVTVKAVAGNHASQATAASRPVLRARYNLLTYSEQFDNAAWFAGSTTVSANQATAPDGTVTADLVYVAITGASRYIWRNASVFTASAQVITSSFYLKASSWSWVMVNGTGTNTGVWFNIATGQKGTESAGYTGTITDAGNGWWRCTVTETRTGTVQPTVFLCDANNSLTATASGTNGVYLWGAQLSYGSSAGTYQRIAAATDYATAGFLPYLAFDGTDDFVASSAINFSTTDKMTLCTGVTKNSDALRGVFAHLGNTASATFRAEAPDASLNTFAFYTTGSAVIQGAGAAVAAPATRVFTGIGDIAADTNLLRLNGTQVASNTADQGTGNYSNAAVNVGRRGDNSLFFNGRIYQLVVCGKTLSASELASTEAYVATKTGVTL